MRLSPAAAAGLVAGALFFLHALVPNSRVLPFIWPLIGGGVAAYLLLQEQREARIGASLKAGALAGGVAGVFFVITTTAMHVLATLPGFASTAALLGTEAPIAVSAATILGLALAAGIGLAVAVVAGAAVHPLARGMP